MKKRKLSNTFIIAIVILTSIITFILLETFSNNIPILESAPTEHIVQPQTPSIHISYLDRGEIFYLNDISQPLKIPKNPSLGLISNLDIFATNNVPQIVFSITDYNNGEGNVIYTSQNNAWKNQKLYSYKITPSIEIELISRPRGITKNNIPYIFFLHYKRDKLRTFNEYEIIVCKNLQCSSIYTEKNLPYLFLIPPSTQPYQNIEPYNFDVKLDKQTGNFFLTLSIIKSNWKHDIKLFSISEPNNKFIVAPIATIDSNINALANLDLVDAKSGTMSFGDLTTTPSAYFLQSRNSIITLDSGVIPFGITANNFQGNPLVFYTKINPKTIYDSIFVADPNNQNPTPLINVKKVEESYGYLDINNRFDIIYAVDENHPRLPPPTLRIERATLVQNGGNCGLNNLFRCSTIATLPKYSRVNYLRVADTP